MTKQNNFKRCFESAMFLYFSVKPSNSPTNSPTMIPTNSPTDTPTNTPSNNPTNNPSNSPSNSPTNSPSNSEKIKKNQETKYSKSVLKVQCFYIFLLNQAILLQILQQ